METLRYKDSFKVIILKKQEKTKFTDTENRLVIARSEVVGRWAKCVESKGTDFWL